MKKAIIIGASSGIGRALAEEMFSQGYQVGLMARRVELLKELAQGREGAFIGAIDLGQPAAARVQLQQLVEGMAGVDLIVISSGTGHINPELDWSKEEETMAVNVAGFAALAAKSMEIFRNQGYGHLVGISSMAALMGSGDAPAYGASKAFVTLYLEALGATGRKQGIHVTEIRPGFVDTAMAQGEGLFWVAPVDKAARQILRGIQRKRKVVYITRRWRLIAWLLKLRRLFM